MARFKPSAVFSVAMCLLIPTYETVLGVPTKTYPSVQKALEDGKRFNGSLRTYGGTEREVNGLYSVEDTAIIETWYRPDIKADCRIVILESGDEYEVLGRPEDIELRHQFLKFKVHAVEGDA